MNLIAPLSDHKRAESTNMWHVQAVTTPHNAVSDRMQAFGIGTFRESNVHPTDVNACRQNGWTSYVRTLSKTS